MSDGLGVVHCYPVEARHAAGQIYEGIEKGALRGSMRQHKGLGESSFDRQA